MCQKCKPEECPWHLLSFTSHSWEKGEIAPPRSQCLINCTNSCPRADSPPFMYYTNWSILNSYDNSELILSHNVLTYNLLNKKQLNGFVEILSKSKQATYGFSAICTRPGHFSVWNSELTCFYMGCIHMLDYIVVSWIILFRISYECLAAMYLIISHS